MGIGRRSVTCATAFVFIALLCEQSLLNAQFGPSVPSPGRYNPPSRPSSPRPSIPRPGYQPRPSTRPQPYRTQPNRSPSYPNQPRPGQPYRSQQGTPSNPTLQPGYSNQPTGGVRNPFYRSSRSPYPSGANLRFGTSPTNRVYGQPLQPVGPQWQRANSLARGGKTLLSRNLISDGAAPPAPCS